MRILYTVYYIILLCILQVYARDLLFPKDRTYYMKKECNGKINKWKLTDCRYNVEAKRIYCNVKVDGKIYIARFYGIESNNLKNINNNDTIFTTKLIRGNDYQTDIAINLGCVNVPFSNIKSHKSLGYFEIVTYTNNVIFYFYLDFAVY
ncbi:hypothetical protein BCR32DRAFT_242945 [Anaeromyces robustus]|uniref:Uncharacterized protein n=1 Tax=Anaeromyces robustus TaxID=1754192 RepID=A0A1Y1XDY5_9FUNG|nr:hypothetical protein BCR32DRAFT_242945 [Anaeromyces robustus]|eukprot:ORX83970.1 hypothetical protein BCR32DRAFT_242945 [Anaeromyces robustus]